MQPWLAFGNLTRHLIDLVLPPTCVVCHEALPPTEPTGFCPLCYAKLPFTNWQQLVRPALPLSIFSFEAPLLYIREARALMLAFKFADQTHLAAPLARLMLPFVPPDTDVILPVPMHPSRLRERTYNQAALLAQAVAAMSHKSVDVMALTRLIASDGQVNRTRTQRLRLSSRHFEADPAVVHGRHVVLIDDILTTGSTARACALALRRAGATRVSVRTLCFTTHEM